MSALQLQLIFLQIYNFFFPSDYLLILVVFYWGEFVIYFCPKWFFHKENNKSTLHICKGNRYSIHNALLTCGNDGLCFKHKSLPYFIE